MLYLGVSSTHEAQLNILQALTRKFKLHPDLKLERIAEQCPFHYTGADFYALCADALLKAMSRKAEELEATTRENNREAVYLSSGCHRAGVGHTQSHSGWCDVEVKVKKKEADPPAGISRSLTAHASRYIIKYCHCADRD